MTPADEGLRTLSGTGSRLTLFSLILTLAAFAMSVNALPPVLTSVAADFRVQADSFGYLFSLQFFVFMIASFTGGTVIEKTGIKPGLLVVLGLTGLSISFFIAPLISGFRGLVFWFLFLGFCGGLVETFSSVLTAAYDRPGSGRMLNLSQVFYCIGAIAAPQIVALLFGKQMSWKVIFIFFGFFEIFITAFFIVFSIDDIKGHSSVSEKGIPDQKEREKISMFKSPLFLLLGFSIFFYVLIESFLVFWLPSYFEKFYFLTPARAAWRLSFFWYGLVAGRIIMIFIPERYSLWRILLVSSTGMLVCSFLLSFPWNPITVILMIIMIGFFAGPVWSAFVAIGRNTNRSAMFISGVIGAGSLGASIGPLVSSFVIRTGGFGLFFPVLFSGILILTAFIIFTEVKIRKQEIYG